MLRSKAFVFLPLRGSFCNRQQQYNLEAGIDGEIRLTLLTQHLRNKQRLHHAFYIPVKGS